LGISIFIIHIETKALFKFDNRSISFISQFALYIENDLIYKIEKFRRNFIKSL